MMEGKTPMKYYAQPAACY